MREADQSNILEHVAIDPSWAFANKTRKDTAYITHGYHRYPAKFIPQIAARLIEEWTNEGDLVIDPFGGCGTTLIEAKINRRPSIGTDINPVAVLISKAKKTPISTQQAAESILALNQQIKAFNAQQNIQLPKNERIDYWFKQEEKRKLAFLLNEISKIQPPDIQTFCLCGFSNILKNCSLWSQRSNKPIRDLTKQPQDPFRAINRQYKSMLRGNANYLHALRTKNAWNIPCQVFCADARQIPTPPESAQLIVTSPPYVTSYEYADLHQQTALWLSYTNNLAQFRQQFIGTTYHAKQSIETNSEIADNIRKALLLVSPKTAQEVAYYFGEMNQVFQEMHRVLKKGGRCCIVIGDTHLKGVKIRNAEVFVEQMQNIGFRLIRIIQREIPAKNLPSARDKTTGRFTKTTNKDKIFAYPTEYIVIMQKNEYPKKRREGDSPPDTNKQNNRFRVRRIRTSLPSLQSLINRTKYI